MIEITDKRDCCGCFACANACPFGCIEMKEDNEGFLYPVTDEEKCTKCGKCLRACTLKNENKEKSAFLKVYACKNKDETVRLSSSSGGMFSLLAGQVLDNGGVVFGAIFDENLNVIHSKAETEEELKKMRGSKYVQSSISNTYNEAKALLDKGRQVLFTGTPCQIAGLKSYLGRDYNSLVTADIVCHGVPSPKVFNKYIDECEQKYKSKVTHFNFRNKDDGWKKYKTQISFESGTVISQLGSNNTFIKGFLSDLYNRPSCAVCKCKYPNGSSDITIADYWGIETNFPEFDDDKGVSLVLTHTEKGQTVFNNLSDKMYIQQSDLEHALIYNPCISKSAKPHRSREKFFNAFENSSFEFSLNTYLKTSFIQNIFSKFKSIMSKLFLI